MNAGAQATLHLCTIPTVIESRLNQGAAGCQAVSTLGRSNIVQSRALGFHAFGPHLTSMIVRATPRSGPVLSALILSACLAGIGDPCLAQYDRDGRYVPSPNGIPTDPYARPIPGYSGTPGQPSGTPIEPRAAIPQVPRVAPLSPPPQARQPRDDDPRHYPVPLTARDCRKGWSASSQLTRRAFDRQCQLLRER